MLRVHSTWRLSICVAVALLVASLCFGADPWVQSAAVSQMSIPSPERTTIKVDVPLVLINVTVTDPMTRLVPGLTADHFKVKEDKALQYIAYFGAEDAPLSVGLLFDTSGSIGDKMAKAREAVAQFFRTANPDDECFLLQFSSQPVVMTGFTSRFEEIQNSLHFVPSKGQTSLLDAVAVAILEMKKAKHSRKALLIVSDGADNASRYTTTEIKRMIKEADVQIYGVGVFEPASTRRRTPEEWAGPELLSTIAEQTGGRLFEVENLNELPDITAQISIELRNQYVLGYTPTNQARDGKWRRVKVDMVRLKGMPPLRAHFRRGYYAPSR